MQKLFNLFRYIGFLKGLYTSVIFAVWLMWGGGAILVITIANDVLQSVVTSKAWFAVFVVSIVFLYTIVVLAFLGFLLSNKAGINSPRYLNWYKLPIRKLSWKFDNCLSLNTRSGKNVKAAQFNAWVRINWGNGIKPKRAIIRSLNKDLEMELKLETDPHFKPVSDATLIPKGKKYWNIKGVINDEKTDVEDFLREYSGFDFIFEYDNSTFKKRFSRESLDLMVDRCRQSVNQKPEPEAY